MVCIMPQSEILPKLYMVTIFALLPIVYTMNIEPRPAGIDDV